VPRLTARSISRVIWWIIIAFGLVVGGVLLLLDYYLFGVIIGGFAVLRLMYTLSLPNRRGPMWLSPVSDSERALLRSMARDEFLVAAGAMGMSGAQLRKDFNGGMSIAEMASSAGAGLEPVIDAIVSDASARIDRAVAQGQSSRMRVIQQNLSYVCGPSDWSTSISGTSRVADIEGSS
jgi:hypothetical protein